MKKKDEKFLASVKKEMKQVKWPEAKDILKYSIATIVFCIFLGGFFLLVNFLMAIIKGLV